MAYWYVGVFQSGTEKATMLLRRMSLKIVQDCVAVEYSDFSVAAEEDFYRLSVGGEFTSTTAFATQWMGFCSIIMGETSPRRDRDLTINSTSVLQ